MKDRGDVRSLTSHAGALDVLDYVRRPVLILVGVLYVKDTAITSAPGWI